MNTYYFCKQILIMKLKGRVVKTKQEIFVSLLEWYSLDATMSWVDIRSTWCIFILTLCTKHCLHKSNLGNLCQVPLLVYIYYFYINFNYVHLVLLGGGPWIDVLQVVQRDIFNRSLLYKLKMKKPNAHWP